MTIDYLGIHALVEFYGCNSQILNNKEEIKKMMLEAAKKSGATIVADVFHNFNPHGLSGVVVIAESHLAIHTWPEHHCASVDFFSCSPKIDFEKAILYLKQELQATTSATQQLKRGNKERPIQKNKDS